MMDININIQDSLMIPENKAVSFQKGFKTERTTVGSGNLFLSSRIPECLIPFVIFTSSLRDHSKRPSSSQFEPQSL